jgi:hypothetical protein
MELDSEYDTMTHGSAVPRPDDICSFNGIPRRELLWRGAHLHGRGHALVCSWCAELVRDMFDESPDVTAQVSDLRCSFCGRLHERIASGAKILICDACARAFLAQERPSWGAVLAALDDVRDAACLLSLATESWPVLRAGGIPVSDCEPDLECFGRAICAGGAVTLVTRSATVPCWSVEQLRRSIIDAPPSQEDREQLCRRLQDLGIILEIS